MLQQDRFGEKSNQQEILAAIPQWPFLKTEAEWQLAEMETPTSSTQVLGRPFEP